MTEPTTLTLGVPGGRLHYDIRDADKKMDAPALLRGETGFARAAAAANSLYCAG